MTLTHTVRSIYPFPGKIKHYIIFVVPTKSEWELFNIYESWSLQNINLFDFFIVQLPGIIRIHMGFDFFINWRGRGWRILLDWNNINLLHFWLNIQSHQNSKHQIQDDVWVLTSIIHQNRSGSPLQIPHDGVQFVQLHMKRMAFLWGD